MTTCTYRSCREVPERPFVTPVMGTATASMLSAPRRQSASPVAVVLVADDVELLVELHVDLVAVVERDFDLVLALLVVDLRAGDSAFSRVGEGCRARSLQGVAGDGGVGSVVFWSVVADDALATVSPAAATAPIAEGGG